MSSNTQTNLAHAYPGKLVGQHVRFRSHRDPAIRLCAEFAEVDATKVYEVSTDTGLSTGARVITLKNGNGTQDSPELSAADFVVV